MNAPTVTNRPLPKRVPACVTRGAYPAAVEWVTKIVEGATYSLLDDESYVDRCRRLREQARVALHAAGARGTWATCRDGFHAGPGDFHDFALLVQGRSDVAVEVGFEISVDGDRITLHWSTSMGHRIVE